MVSTTIIFQKDNVQPPVYIAGSFTGWSPIEMSFEMTESDGSPQNVFSYKADLEPGDYQYKFRLGPGDWWVLDESSPTANDGQGNVNNVTSVKPQASGSPPEEPVEKISKPAAPILNAKDAHIIENEHDRPSENGLSTQHEDVEPHPPVGVAVSNLLDSKEDQRMGNPKVADVRRVHFDGDKTQPSEGDIATRKDSIPDFAPPPYSIATNGAVPSPAASTTNAVPSEKQTTGPVANSNPDDKITSLILRMCSTRNLVLVAAIVAVPAAVSYYLRR